MILGDAGAAHTDRDNASRIPDNITNEPAGYKQEGLRWLDAHTMGVSYLSCYSVTAISALVGFVLQVRFLPRSLRGPSMGTLSASYKLYTRTIRPYGSRQTDIM